MSDGLASPDEEAHFSKRLEEHDDFTKTDSNSNEGISLIKDRTFGGIVKNHTECHLSIGKTVCWVGFLGTLGWRQAQDSRNVSCLQVIQQSTGQSSMSNIQRKSGNSSMATRLWQLTCITSQGSGFLGRLLALWAVNQPSEPRNATERGRYYLRPG